MINLKSFKRIQELGTPDLLPYALLVEDGVIMNKDGSLMASWFYTGKDDASMTPHDRNTTNERVNNAFRRLGSGWCIHTNAIRVKTDIYPAPEASQFPDQISELIDEERREYFEQAGNSYESYFTITLTYTPAPVAQKKMADLFYSGGEEGSSLGDKSLYEFNKSIKEFEENLGITLDLRRMKAKKKNIEGVEVTIDEQLSLLDYQFHQSELRDVIVPNCGMFLDSYVGRYPFCTGVTPKIGDRYISVIAIDGFPSETHAGLLNQLSEIGVEFRWSTRYIPLDAFHADKEIKKYSRKWGQKVKGFIASLTDKPNAKIDHNAAVMTSDAQMAESDAKGDHVTFGYYTGCLVIMHEDQEYLEAASSAARKSLLRLGFNGARVEDVNTVEAWLGSMAGNSFANIRRPLIHSLNLADLSPTSSVYAGQEHNPCDFYPENSPPLAMAKTDASTPFRLNLHVSDLGHTLIFGPTGAGKSTLLAFLASQMLRYPNMNVFAFDKGLSMYAINQATGGNHYNIGGETSEGEANLAFAPLSHLETEGDFQWALDWVEILVQLQLKEVTIEHKGAIRDALIQHRGSNYRSLSNFRQQVQDTEVKDALRVYSEMEIYNANSDTLREGHFECFEIEELMNFPEEKSLPLMIYLFRCVERKLKGQPSFIIIDEAWMVLGHEVFRDKVREWLKVLRKKNCGVILATQSISDAAGSGILDVLAESCPTKIYLPNDKAAHEEFSKYYTQLGLNSAQKRIVADSTPKKHYFVTSPKGDRLIDLGLGTIALAFCAKSSPEDLAEIRHYQHSFGADWAMEWVNAQYSQR